jgi:hypothetical protein
MLNNEYNSALAFQLQVVSFEFGAALSGLLRQSEECDIEEPHIVFVAALNMVLVRIDEIKRVF